MVKPTPVEDDKAAASDYDDAASRSLTAAELDRSRPVRRQDGFDQPVTVRLSSSQVEGLKRVARAQGTTVSRLLRASVDDLLRDPTHQKVGELMAALEDAVRAARLFDLPDSPSPQVEKRKAAS